MFSAAQNILSIPENALPLQGAGFLSEVGKPFKPAVSVPQAAAYAVHPLNPKFI